MQKQTSPYTYGYKDGSFSTVGMEELFDRQNAHDDLRIRDRFIEYDSKNHDNVAYLTYIIDKREDEGAWERYVKVVKLCKVYNVPKELREKKALMVSQDELLSSLWKSDTNFICIYCNMPEDEYSSEKDIHGFYYCYGVQCVMRIYSHFRSVDSMNICYDENDSEGVKIAQTLRELKKQADARYQGLLALLRGNFRQSQFLPLTMREAEAIRSTIEEAPQLQVLRGVPKTHISSASGVTTSLDGVTTTPDGIEQNEEYIRGLLHKRYANVIMAVPIPHDEILQWSQNIAKELSKYKSQYQGQISHNAGISIPMVFAGNLSATLGNTQGVTDTTGETLGTTQGQSDNYSHGVGTNQGTSHNLGYSQGQSIGVADSVSQANTNASTQGLSQSHTMTDSQGVSRTSSEGVTHGVSNTESLGRSHTVGTSDTYGETQSMGRSLSHSVGNSTTVGHTMGETLGTTRGITTGNTVGHTVGDSLTQGHTVGNTLGHTVGNTQGTTQGHTVGNTQGQTIGDTFGTTQGHTVGNTQGTTAGHTIGDTTGHTVGNTTGHTVGNTTGHTVGNTTGHTVGNTTGHTVGNTTGHTIGNTTGHTTGTTITDGNTFGYSNSHGGSSTISDSTSTARSASMGHTIGQTATNSNGTSFSQGHTTGTSGSYSHGDSFNLGHSDTSGKTMTHTDGTTTSGNLSGGLLGLVNVGQGSSVTDSDAHGQTHSDGNTSSRGWTNSYSSGWNSSDSVTNGQSASRSLGITDSNSYSQGVTNSNGHTVANGTSWSNGTTNSQTHSMGHTASDSTSHSVSDSTSRSVSDSTSRSVSDSTSRSVSDSTSRSVSDSTSRSVSDSTSRSVSNSLSKSMSNSVSDSLSQSHSTSNSRSLSSSVSDSLSKSFSQSLSDSLSQSNSDSLSRGKTNSWSNAQSLANSLANSHSLSNSYSVAQGRSESWGEGLTRSESLSHSVGKSVSDGVTQSVSRGVTDSTSQSISNGLTRSQSIGNSIGKTDSMSQGVSSGMGKTANQGLSRSLSDAQGVSAGTSTSDSRGTGTTTSNSNSLSSSQGLSNSRSNSLGTGQGLNMSFGPTVGVSRSYAVFDEEKGNLIKLLEASNTRLNLAARTGAYHVDCYIVSYDAGTMQGIAMTAVTSWGGDNEIATVQCVTPDELTQSHLLKHTSVFEPCTMKDNTPNIADNYLWSTIMLTSELAALTHLPRVETGGISTVATNIPAFSVRANVNGEIYLGKQINYEDGLPSYGYYFSKQNFMHTLVCGASGSGKTTSAVRMAREVLRNYPDMKIFALDWKNSWRVLKRFAPNGVDDFEFYGLDYKSVRPIRMNLFIPPKHVGALQWADKVIESVCLGYGFGTKMYSVLKSASRISMLLHGTLKLNSDDVPIELQPQTQAELDDFHKRISKTTFKEIYQIVVAMKAGDLAASPSLNQKISSLSDKNLMNFLKSKFLKQGQGMQDAYDSILAKLESYYAGELHDLYCVDDYDKTIHIEDLIDGKRIVVLEGGDLDAQTKKAVIGLISWGMFMYSRLKKNRERIVEKRFYILEEAHRVIDNPDSGNAAPLDVGETIFDIILNEAREYGVYAMIIVQAPSELPAAMITNCSILIIHRLGNKDDLELVTGLLRRNARLDNRDVPIWLTKQPIGQAIVSISNTVNHDASEPVLVQVARCPNEPPDNEEIVLDMEDVQIPIYMRQMLNDDEYLNLYKDELDKLINHEPNEIEETIENLKEDSYKDYEVDVG